MLKLINTKNGFSLPTSIFSEDDTSDTDFYYTNLLNKAGLNSINIVFDTELFEYSPISPTLKFFIYFLDFRDMNFNNNVVNNIEPAFNNYLQTAESILFGNTNNLTVYDFKQANQNILIKNDYEIDKSSVELLQSKPYLVTDPVRELNKIQPLNNGIPLFYDTFTFPFAKKIDSWKDLPNKYSNKSFLYNSFLLIDIFTSSDPAKQKRIMSIPIFVNNRYMMYEKSINGIKQLRPTFLLQSGCEGYSFNFLKTYNINTFFAKFSFWDALSGTKIPLLASGINTKIKKGVQSASNFIKENEYLMYKLDYSKLTYQIYEYNSYSKAYDLEAYDFDLYQLVYDDYWAGKIVPNTRPIPLIEPVVIPGDDPTHVLSVTTNKTLINVSETLPITYIDSNIIPGVFPTPQTSYYDFASFFFNGFYTFKNDLPSVKNTINIQANNLFTVKGAGDIIANSYIHKIDTFVINNTHPTDSVILKDINISDIGVETVTLGSHGLVGQVFNTDEVANITNTFQSAWNDPIKKIFSENYITYSNYAPFSNSIISQITFKYLTLIGEKNSFGVIPDLDYYYNGDFISYMNTKFNVNNPNDYNNTIINNSGFFNNTFNNEISPLLFLNSNIGKQLNMFKNYINTTYIDDAAIREAFANEIEFGTAISLKEKIERFADVINVLSDRKQITQVLNDVKFQKDLRNIREYMYGLNASIQKTGNLIIKPGESFDIDINLFIGYISAYTILNIKEPLTFTGNLNVTILNQHNNQHKYIIPIKYKLNFK